VKMLAQAAFALTIFFVDLPITLGNPFGPFMFSSREDCVAAGNAAAGLARTDGRVRVECVSQADGLVTDIWER
jgi:hypothetical protein